MSSHKHLQMGLMTVVLFKVYEVLVMIASSELLNNSGELHWTTILLVVLKRVSNWTHSDIDMHTCT